MDHCICRRASGDPHGVVVDDRRCRAQALLPTRDNDDVGGESANGRWRELPALHYHSLASPPGWRWSKAVSFVPHDGEISLTVAQRSHTRFAEPRALAEGHAATIVARGGVVTEQPNTVIALAGRDVATQAFAIEGESGVTRMRAAYHVADGAETIVTATSAIADVDATNAIDALIVELDPGTPPASTSATSIGVHTRRGLLAVASRLGIDDLPLLAAGANDGRPAARVHDDRDVPAVEPLLHRSLKVIADPSVVIVLRRGQSDSSAESFVCADETYVVSARALDDGLLHLELDQADRLPGQLDRLLRLHSGDVPRAVHVRALRRARGGVAGGGCTIGVDAATGYWLVGPSDGSVRPTTLTDIAEVLGIAGITATVNDGEHP